MSHSVPRRSRNGASSLVGGGDLLGLAAHAVGVEARNGADADRVVADREVLVAALARGAAHLEDRRPAVRPGRVAVQVAADRRPSSTSVGGSPREPALAQLGRARTGGRARGRRPPRRARRAAARARRRTPASRSRARARCRGAPARRRRARPARPRPSRRARAARRARRPRRSAAAPRSARAPAPGRRGDDDGEPLARRRASGAGRRPRSPPSASAIDSTSGRLRLSSSGRRRGRARLPRERREQLALRLRPDARHLLQPPGRGRLAQLVERADAERRARSRACA